MEMHGLRPNVLKSSHFSHSKCYTKNVYEWNFLKLSTYIFIDWYSRKFGILGDFLPKNS